MCEKVHASPPLMACVGILKCAAKVVHIVQKFFGEMVVGAEAFCSFILQPKKKRAREKKETSSFVQQRNKRDTFGVFWYKRWKMSTGKGKRALPKQHNSQPASDKQRFMNRVPHTNRHNRIYVETPPRSFVCAASVPVCSHPDCSGRNYVDLAKVRRWMIWPARKAS